jgi:hypothetical protein
MTASELTNVARWELPVGPLLAEGGEGRVYELVGKPGVLYKEYRRPARAAPFAELVAWRHRLAVAHPDLAARVDASSAWPTCLVEEPGLEDGTVAGLLLPRAPRRFSVRHRDGVTRLATLSYLTADPGQRAAAYGLALPEPFSPERIGLVYALARLLEALQSAEPAIGHGDLSTKNVLWSLERGPEVFVLDCDSCECYGPDGVPLDDEHRRRAMTPNWDDPAIPAGANPTLYSDRYSLALIFLRVVGAAHFPLQARQRRGEVLTVDFGVPPLGRRARSLADDAPIWDLCARCLSAGSPLDRPPAAAWVGALEEILDDLGAMRTVRAVWGAQGGGSPSPAPSRLPGPGPTDVVVTPVPAPERVRRWERTGPPTRVRPASPSWQERRPGSVALRPAVAASTPPPAPQGVDVGAHIRAGVRRGAESWGRLHAETLSALVTPGRRGEGVRRVGACVAVDFVLLVAAFFVVAMLVSPWLGI